MKPSACGARSWVMVSVCLLVSFMFGITGVSAQVNAFNASRQTARGSNSNAFNRGRVNNFNDYRASLNAEYAKMVRQEWGGFNFYRGYSLPDKDVKPQPPTPYKDDGRQRDDRQIAIDGTPVTPIKNNRSVNPIAPVKEDPTVESTSFSFTYLGTPAVVRVPHGAQFSLRGVSEEDIADAWERLSAPEFAPMVADCIDLRQKLKLCDWAYLGMLDAFTQGYCGNGNAASALMAYIFSQSGYKVRLAESDGILDLLFASHHKVYDHPYLVLDDGEAYYPYRLRSGSIRVCRARFKNEQSLSLWVNNYPSVEISPSGRRTISSERYGNFSVAVSINKNMMDFYDGYPVSEIGDNFVTRWAIYANTPTSDYIRQQLYPQIKTLISGLGELEAVERILNWVQTGFVYEYDDKVWGHDRAFFPEETLYYPYCDCEDRSILFTRIVRDLLNLKCLLIYYPGHLAAAVCFNGDVAGDYIMQGGRKFIVTDPTFIGAPVGRTMTSMDNSSAKVIVLN